MVGTERGIITVLGHKGGNYYFPGGHKGGIIVGFITMWDTKATLLLCRGHKGGHYCYVGPKGGTITV